MLRILNTLSLLIFLIAAVWSVRLFLGRARRAACGWAAAAMAALIVCGAYYLPFHIRFDPDDLILVSPADGPHQMIDGHRDPDVFAQIAAPCETLAFRRPFFPDARLSDAFQRDDITLSNHGRDLYIVLPAGGAPGYVVLNDEASAPLAADLLQVLGPFP